MAYGKERCWMMDGVYIIDLFFDSMIYHVLMIESCKAGSADAD